MRSASAALAALAACGSGEVALDLQFSALVNGAPLACGRVYDHVGVSDRSVELADARLYVHDPQLITAAGTLTPLALDPDPPFQRDRLALLDFEDGRGQCRHGDPATRTTIRGTAPADDYVGIRFELGRPHDLAPLGSPELGVGAPAAADHLRLDVTPSYYLHVRAAGCDRLPSGERTCAVPNVTTVVLMGDLARAVIVFDLGRLWADLDVARPPDAADPVPGCLADAADPECPAVLARLGLDLDGQPNGDQSLFTLEVGP